jgi:signal transduction histidine kinase
VIVKYKQFQREVQPMTADHILLLEDRPLDALLVCTTLETAGFAVDVTRNETQYVDALKVGGYSAIVTDNSIPGASPSRAIELAREWHAAVPVICISGAINEHDGNLVLEQGVVDYIGKDQLWRLPYALKRSMMGPAPSSDLLFDALSATVVETNRQLQVAHEEMSTLSRCITHDIQSPLNGIHQISQLMLSQDNLDIAECRTIFATISDDALLLTDMTAGLLKLYTMSLHELKSEPVDISAAAHSILSNLSQLSPRRKVEITIAPSLVATGDPDLLHCLFENLINNAWKYSAKVENATIAVGALSASHCDNACDTQTFFVRDNGAGFDMQYAAKLFKPFQRMHSVTDFDGLGLGLATVNRIVRRYNGKVWAQSIKGQGTTFFFTLPNQT